MISLATVKKKQLRVSHYCSLLKYKLAVEMYQKVGINVENQNVIFQITYKNNTKAI